LRVGARQIKAVFFGIDLVLAIFVLFFLANAVRYLLSSAIDLPEPLADASLTHSASSHSKIKSYDEYESLRKSNLFGALSSSSAVPPQAVEETLPETTLELELLGSVASGTETAFAIIRDKRARTEDTYAVGDFIGGDARVEEIRKYEVVIARGGRREVLSMVFGDEGPSVGGGRSVASQGRSSGPPRPAPAAQSSETQDVAIRVVNDNLRYVNKAKFMADMGQNLGSMLNQVQVSPNVVDGKPSGISVNGVGSDPILGQSGLQAGDIVKSVNGVRTNSIEDVLGMADRLQSAPEIRVVVEREGRHRTLVYKLR
jgi:type II secretion system protein C